MPADMLGLVEYVARALADEPDAVKVSQAEKGRHHVVVLEVADADMGRVIGRDGRVANAIRALLDAAPGDERWRLEIQD